MARLLKDQKEQIQKAMLKHAFQSRFDAMCAERADFIDRVYKHVIPQKERDILIALPEGYAKTDRQIVVQIGTGTFTHLHYNGESTDGSYYKWGSPLTKPEPVQRREIASPRSHCRGIIPGSHDLATEYYDLQAKEKKFDDDLDRAGKQIEGILKDITTTQKLEKVWPEALPFLPLEVAPPKLPMVQLEALNEALDLPVAATA